MITVHNKGPEVVTLEKMQEAGSTVSPAAPLFTLKVGESVDVDMAHENFTVVRNEAS